jgi:hypothetical protein
MSLFGRCVGLEDMTIIPVIHERSSDPDHLRSVACIPDAGSNHLLGVQTIGDRESRATDAVALAFARIVSQRYPGTSWLPVKRRRSNDGLVLPTGKVVRLIPGPTDVHAEGRIGHSAASAAN